ncbi:uncharacterized protein PHACADRAFT_203637 [Phanerochaete carnosa HHB-10118-sp]|uniref:NACHT domain-containing protein n=1 Tax=Phanerochaete carnosa (strain HHB-10118-sp) TaxID=650164 RepID=K5WLY5_PHACS|nr:uncharacterized protein PHACADRAFT_203637 [Phanerochaete carnosa HHB-10118-sp]EKM60435.1 hypothetical protein PHACADRAFT_203637 [Phanerochaete carnosa HHB-10118-sp]
MPARGNAVDAILDASSPLLEIAEGALELAPIPGLALIAKGLAYIVERVKVARENNEERHALLAQVKELGTVINRAATKVRTIVAEYDGDERGKKELVEKIKHSDELQERIRDLLRYNENLSTIGELQGRAGELKGGTGISGFSKKFIYASRNQAIMSEMKQALTSATNLFQQIQRQLQEAEDQRILDSILRASASYRSVDELKSGFMQGTREELFAELDRWSAGQFPEDELKRFYLLCGGAGLGKSSIAHQLCTRIETAEQPSLRLGASFFFVRGGGDLEAARLLFPTLVYQLAQFRPTLRPHIVNAAREYLKHGDSQQTQHAFEKLLREALTAAPVSDQVPTLLVIDGLDECKDRNLVPDLLRSLLSLVRELPWLYVFAASRPEPHILSVLASSSSANIVHRRQLEDTLKNWAGDVEFYLKKTVPKIPLYADYLDKHPDALERLISHAAGVFIFARIVVNFLDTHQNHPEEWFELILSDGGPAVLPLDTLYLQILQSAFPPEDLRASPRQRERLLSLLRFVALESERVNPDTIAFYERELSVDDVFFMVDRLRSVLTIDKDEDVVPLHASFGEFLVDDRRCSDALYHVDKSEGHAHLACVCLSAMSFENYTYVRQRFRDLTSMHAHINLDIMERSWSVHVRQAAYTSQLEKQLSQFVGDIRLTLHSWVYKEFAPQMENHRLQIVWDYLQPSGARKAICSEFLKFSIYVNLWQFGVLTSPNRTPPQISSSDISQAIRRLPREFEQLLPDLDLAVENSLLARYQARMENFMTEVNRDEETRKLWCEDFYTYEQIHLAGLDRPDSEPSTPLHGPITASPSSLSIATVASETLSTPSPESNTIPLGDGGTASDTADDVPSPLDP